jgi:hypothetical protein
MSEGASEGGVAEADQQQARGDGARLMSQSGRSFRTPGTSARDRKQGGKRQIGAAKPAPASR